MTDNHPVYLALRTQDNVCILKRLSISAGKRRPDYASVRPRHRYTYATMFLYRSRFRMSSMQP